MNTGLDELGFILLFFVFLLSLYAFINTISDFGEDWDGTSLKALGASLRLGVS